jgi:hypothetical protein
LLSFKFNTYRYTERMGLSGIDQDELDAAMEVVEHASMLNIDLVGLSLPAGVRLVSRTTTSSIAGLTVMWMVCFGCHQVVF